MMFPREKERLDSFLYEKEILKRLRQSCASGKKSLVVAFEELLEFDKDIAFALLNRPQSFFKASDEILEQITKIPGIRLRVRGLEPAYAYDPLHGLGAENVEKLVQVQGTVKEVGNVQTEKFVQIQGTVEDAGEAQFTKVSVSSPISFRQDETEEYEVFKDYQVIKVGTTPVELARDLVGTIQKGDRVVVTGILKTIPTAQQSSSGIPILDKLIEANHIEKAPMILPSLLADETASLEKEFHEAMDYLRTQIDRKNWKGALQALEYASSIARVLERKIHTWD